MRRDMTNKKDNDKNNDKDEYIDKTFREDPQRLILDLTRKHFKQLRPSIPNNPCDLTIKSDTVLDSIRNSCNL